jgi:zinc/manganese transport system substrate-binding protein
VHAIASAITNALKKIDSGDASSFENNFKNFADSLTALTQKISEIHGKYAGTPVALTETIYLYQTELEGLNVLTPFSFMKAIAEGNDPTAAIIATVNDELNQGKVKVLIYNKQTVTPITTNLQNEAMARHIPIVPVTETMPSAKTYQSWMMDQLNVLEAALHQATGK